MQEQTSKIRDAFEAHMAQFGWFQPVRVEDGYYDLQSQWEIWQAATQAATQGDAGVEEENKRLHRALQYVLIAFNLGKLKDQSLINHETNKIESLKDMVAQALQPNEGRV